jgi:HK97 family phage prohead protease
MKHKQRMRLEIKEISPEGSFEGLLSPYGNVDGGGDVVKPGAYTKTLQEQGNTRPLLWQHKTDVPIGELALEDRTDGLWCKGQLLMALPEATKAYLLMKARIVKGLSVGFESVKDAVSNGVRTLSEIKLYEGSVVTFPMNESALITSVKARGETKGDFNEELTERQLQDAGYQMDGALWSALRSATWADMTREEKIALVAVVIQQFTDAYLAYYPAYLDTLAEMYGGMETWNAKRFETKAGRKISAATKESIQAAADHSKSAQDLLLALIADEAGEDDSTTSEGKAAAPNKTEPEPHSALMSQLDNLKGAFQWNLSNKN